ncbi:MAG: nuclear transport factor 2 family protein [Saprospiraceae bacterium]|nr:nuclear transport factor 2 family protein [Saprospiraceae bacterium]
MQLVVNMLIIFICSGLSREMAGQSNEQLNQQILLLHSALVSGDSATLDLLLDSKMTYGHSNGWIETKQELIENNRNRRLIYNSIEEDSIVIFETGHTAIARFNAVILGQLEDKKFHLKLGVCQTWMWANNRWKMLARQAVKLENLAE